MFLCPLRPENIILLLLLLLRNNPSRQYPKVLYRWEVRRRGKTEKHRKVRVKKKMVGVNLSSLFPAKEWEAVTQSGTRGIDYKTKRRPKEVVSSKAGRSYMY